MPSALEDLGIAAVAWNPLTGLECSIGLMVYVLICRTLIERQKAGQDVVIETGPEDK